MSRPGRVHKGIAETDDNAAAAISDELLAESADPSKRRRSGDLKFGMREAGLSDGGLLHPWEGREAAIAGRWR